MARKKDFIGGFHKKTWGAMVGSILVTTGVIPLIGKYFPIVQKMVVTVYTEPSWVVHGALAFFGVLIIASLYEE